LIFNNETFDCTGFAVELFKRARASGFRVGFVDLEFGENKTGHMLNVFQTVDKGLIFIDVTGNEKGTERDKVAYIKLGNFYGTIELNGVKEKRIACDISCSQFAKELTYVNYQNLFDYDYFLESKKCVEFYTECIDQYNKAVDEFNKGNKKYSYAELKKWFENLEILGNELSRDNFYIISQGDEVKNIQIYW